MAEILHVFEGEVEWKKEDGGRALITTLESALVPCDLFVRVQSWDETGVHSDAHRLTGKKIRVTVEVAG